PQCFCDPLFNQTGSLQGLVCAALFHGLEALGGDANGDLFVEFGDEEGLALQVDLAAALAGGVEFGRARAVGIPTADLGFLACYVADSCHIFKSPNNTVFYKKSKISPRGSWFSEFLLK